MCSYNTKESGDKFVEACILTHVCPERQPERDPFSNHAADYSRLYTHGDFVPVCELQTPKPEQLHGYKIKTDCSFGQQTDSYTDGLTDSSTVFIG